MKSILVILAIAAITDLAAAEFKPPRGYQFEYGLPERVVLTKAYDHETGDRYTLFVIREDKKTGYKYPEMTQELGCASTIQAHFATMPGIKELPKEIAGKIHVEYKYMPLYTFEISLNKKHSKYEALKAGVPALFKQVGEHLKDFPDFENPRYLELRKADPKTARSYVDLKYTVRLDLECNLSGRPLCPNHAEWRGKIGYLDIMHYADSPVPHEKTQDNGGGFFAVNHLLNEIVLKWQKENGAEYDPKDLSVLRFWFWYTYTNHEALPDKVRELTVTANDHRHFLNLTTIEPKVTTEGP